MNTSSDKQAFCECGYMYAVEVGFCTKCWRSHLTPEAWAESVATKLAALTREQRMAFIHALGERFCLHCGNDFETGSQYCCVDINPWYE